ncbi:hypothetical protein Desru_2478 [Desulforamulus ruminis DSM 2154]|uniref:Uncharacterized protein n=2 Tax=Desulforamulus ruminis TaxID=1564 RepID=F6DNZ2_DESRL|nr:hypothetical protein Desru_2478 [Desulforamulus ruminis DSM 2154]
MYTELEELKQQCHEEILRLEKQIKIARGRIARGRFPFRFDAKAVIQKAEVKIEKIQSLLVKLESLSEQITPVVNDLKEIVGLNKVE